MNTLEKRSVFLLSMICMIRMLGLFMLLPVLSLYVKHLPGATPLLIGLALGIYGFPQALLQIPAGLISDITGRKPVIVAGLVIFAAGSLTAALASNIYGIILGRFLQGAGAIASAVTALVSDLTSERYRTRAMAILGMSIGSSFCLAMVAGPLVSTVMGTPAIFWLTFICSIPAILITVFLVPSPQKNDVQKKRTVSFSDISVILKNKEIMLMAGGAFILHFTLIGLFIDLPVMLENQAGLPLHSHGWFYLGVLILSFFVMLPFIILSERKQCLKQCMQGAVALLFIAALWLVFAHDLVTLMIGVFLYFIAFNFLEASLPSAVSKLSPASTIGTSMGIYSSCQFLGAGLGGVVSGIIAQIANPAMVMIICCSLIAIWWIMTLFIMRSSAQQGRQSAMKMCNELKAGYIFFGYTFNFDWKDKF